MLIIHCPWCGPRAQSEFSYGGAARIARALDTDALTDGQGTDDLLRRKKLQGQQREQWLHRMGCRRWFNAERDTTTYQFIRFYKSGKSLSTPHGAKGKRKQP